VQPLPLVPDNCWNLIVWLVLPVPFERWNCLRLSTRYEFDRDSLDQNQTVTTIRNSEVCSDSTNVLALSVRDGDETEDAEPSIQSFVLHRYCPQAPNHPGTFPHFRALVCQQGDRGSYRFEAARPNI